MNKEQKEKLLKELQGRGYFVGMTADDVTDEKLLEFASKNPSAPGVPAPLKIEDFKELIGKAIGEEMKLATDAIDRKYMKIPSIELTESEKKLSQREQNNLTMRKFISRIVSMPKELTMNTEQSNAAGLYTVPVEFEARVIQLLNDYGIMRRNANMTTMGSLTLTVPKLLTGCTAVWRANDTTAGTESNPAFDQLTFTAKDLDVYAGISKNLLMDSGVDLVGELALLFANAIYYQEDYQGLVGTGSPIDGIFLNSSTTPVVLANGGTDIKNICNDDLTDMITGVVSNALNGAKFYMHRQILSAILKMKDKNDRPIYTLSDQLLILNSKTILGYPYELSEVCPDNTVGVSLPKLLFGNLKFVNMRQRVGLEMRMTDVGTVGSNSAFDKKLMFFALGERLDIKVELAAAFSRLLTAAS